MVVFPNAKINLGLWVLDKREDGYHNIESCFYPVPWKDMLEFVENDTFRFSSSGLDVPGNPKDNLSVKAYFLLKENYSIPELQIHLHKQIPIGAGLGGGSSDASFMLKALNDYFDLGISMPELKDIAGILGADCPFFIENKPKLVSGTGNILVDMDLGLKGKVLSIIYPKIQSITSEAYQSLTPQSRVHSLKNILSKPVNEWKKELSNDFEEYVYKNHPEIINIKNKLYQLGAEYASLSGSGSAIYAISADNLDLRDFSSFLVFNSTIY
jgi:4-diphosphocytidyl-2-C-methyl-D-erythritol kinase